LTLSRVNDKLEEILKGLGVKVGRQSYAYNAAGLGHAGENLYGILQAPRGDATEAIVLVAAWRSIEGEVNRNGVALALTLARYFKRKLSSDPCMRSPRVNSNRLVPVVQRYYHGLPS
jgi:hypothetical protein